MKCVICKNGETETGTTTVTLERDDTVVVIKEVPAEICRNCGEYYLSAEVTQRVMERGEDAVESGEEVKVLRYAA